MRLLKEATGTGLPVVRHPFIHYPNNSVGYALDYQFTVAPVLDPGEDTVEVYLPRGRWVHLWTGEEYGSSERGVYETVRAPIGEQAVFYREDSDVGRKFREELGRGGCCGASTDVVELLGPGGGGASLMRFRARTICSRG